MSAPLPTTSSSSAWPSISRHLPSGLLVSRSPRRHDDFRFVVALSTEDSQTEDLVGRVEHPLDDRRWQEDLVPVGLADEHRQLGDRQVGVCRGRLHVLVLFKEVGDDGDASTPASLCFCRWQESVATKADEDLHRGVDDPLGSVVAGGRLRMEDELDCTVDADQVGNWTENREISRIIN